MIMAVGISLSVYKFLSALELLAALALFVYRFRRRKYFALRLAAALAVLAAAVWAFPAKADSVLFVLLLYIYIFVLELCAAKFCFAESWRNLLFCAIAAYLLKHLAYILFNVLTDVVSAFFRVSNDFNPYLDEPAMLSVLNLLVLVPCYIVAYFLVYWFGYYACASKVECGTEMRLGRAQYIMLAGLVLLAAVLFSLLMSFNENKDALSTWVERGYGFLSCLVVLGLQFSKRSEAEVGDKLQKVQQILAEEQRQYAAIKQNMDAVNIKCHDIKHMIGAFRSKIGVYEEEIDKIEESVRVLGSVVASGNETLDMVLSEKIRRAEVQGVTLCCMADGKLLSFMRPPDIYSLAGNALDNAVAAAAKAEEALRSVTFTLRAEGGMVVLHVENYFTGPLTFENGLPKTTSGDSLEHGFGMLSIKTVAERYGGTVSVEVEEIGAEQKIFHLNILFPQPAGDSAPQGV